MLLDDSLDHGVLTRFLHPSQPLQHVIHKEFVDMLLEHDRVDNSDEFGRFMQAYWVLKRRSRQGVPLLRRLQVERKRKRQE